jgi:hypothetical protein
MTSNLKFEDRLNTISNYPQWKARIENVLRKNKLWDFVNTIVTVSFSDPISLDVHEVKEQRV